MASHLTPLHRAAAEAVASLAGVPATDLKVEQPPRPEFGDLAVGCFVIAKATKRNPAQVAQEIAAAFVPGGLLASASAAGPFVNFRADRAATLRWVVDAALSGDLIPRELGSGQTICIDYSSPNISKALAFHHIRSTGIGHALAQIFRALGYHVVGINHLGDWGTTHGALIAAWKKWAPAGAKPSDLDIAAINELYVRWNDAKNVLKHEAAPKWIAAIAAGGPAREKAEAELTTAVAKVAALEDEAREWFKRLEQGDPEARAIWQAFREVSLAEFASIYAMLGITFEEIRGESDYEPDLARVMAELRDKQLVVLSQGAQVVELEGEKNPIIVEKSDGASTYAVRDFASAQYRFRKYGFARSLYVVDRGQSLHFQMVFKLLRKAGHDWAARCEHVPFGLVRMGGKKSSTRGGSGILLRDVLDEAKARSLAKMVEKPDSESAKVPVAAALLTEGVDLLELAQQVGVGAVVFANLATQRDKDIDFEWDKALAQNGDSGVYLQYSHARCASIMRRANATVTTSAGVEFGALVHDSEWALAKRLLDFGDVVVRASETCEPHIICHFLLELAGEFSRWYTSGNSDPALRVLSDDPVLRTARLALTAAVQKTLATGLSLLGIPAPDQM